MRLAAFLGRLTGAALAAVLLTLVVGAIVNAIFKTYRVSRKLPAKPGKTSMLWKHEFCPDAAMASFARYAVCGILLLVYVVELFGPNVLLNLLINVIIAMVWWAFVYLADHFVVKLVKSTAPADLEFAVSVGKKCPDMKELLKSLNPGLTDEMLMQK